MADDFIDYLNSFNIQSCLVASSIEDLRTGIPLCDLISYFSKNPALEGVIRKESKYISKKEQSLHNLQIALNALNSPWTPEQVYQNQEMLISLYQTVARISKPSNNQKVLEFQSPEDSPKAPLKKRNSTICSLASSIRHDPLNFSCPEYLEESTVVHPSPSPMPMTSSITPITENRKLIICDWLLSMRVLPKNAKLDEIPEICSDGKLFCEILNRIAGRTKAIQGYDKNPKTKTAMKGNVQKALKYLKSFPKFSSQVLWDVDLIVSSDSYAAWHLLDDIRNFFPKYVPRSPSLSLLRKTRNNSIERNNSTSPILTQSFVNNKSQVLTRQTPSPTPSTIYPRSTSYTNTTTPIPFEPTDSMSLNTQQRIRAWLSGLELDHLLDFHYRHFLQDPLRNGTLLCEVVSILEQKVPIVRNPVSINEIRKNIDSAMYVLQKRRVPIPSIVLRNKDSIIQGNAESTWGLLHSLMILYPMAIKKQSVNESMKRESSLHNDSSFFSKKPINRTSSLDFSQRLNMSLVNDKPNTNTWKSRGNQSMIFTSFNSSLLKNTENNENYQLNRYESPINISVRKLVKNKTSAFDWFDVSKTMAPDTQKSILKSILPNNYKWVYNIGISIPKSLDLTDDVIEDFQSGVLLSQIVSKLEKYPIKGIQMSPKTSAAMLHNIKMTFEVLKTKASFSSRLMFVEEEILKGDGNTVRDLLGEIFRIYRHTIVVLSKFRRGRIVKSETFT
ncbi:unnamed protein product [Blepharisma stoltei]|uniref:Calponin-homology (CH) domain-containing protein n=1 Tax=Blepharisma stoltei TaxID=1481888 RepID=A0AAU9JXC6_9CILI|nr:unnamed protein product [Blepharisma stoltei]